MKYIIDSFGLTNIETKKFYEIRNTAFGEYYCAIEGYDSKRNVIKSAADGKTRKECVDKLLSKLGVDKKDVINYDFYY